VQQRGWTLVGEREDNDMSAAGKRKRPGFEAVMEAVEARQVDVIVAWALDRLTRNARERLRLVESCKAAGVSLALVRGSDYDLTTPAGRFSIGILGEVAQMEIDQKGDRQTRAQQQAAAQGRPAGGRRPFGYAQDGITVNEAEAVHVRQAYADLLHGASLKSIAARWNEAGALTTMGNRWSHSTVRETLKNARYAGQRTYRGEVVGPAVWPALVDEDTHAAVCALLALPARRTTASTARKYLLPGLALCWSCGATVATGHTRHGKRVYVCREGKCVSRKAEPVDELVTGVVLARLARPDAAELLQPSDRDALADLRRRRAAIGERLDDLATGLEEGVLTLAAVRRSSERLKAEQAAIDAEMAATVHTDTLGPLVAADDPAAVWERLDVQQRRAVVDALMTVTVLKPEVGRRDFDPETVKIEWKG
jgi:DNA invertase Pin-like site-specific DNA recombinase